MRLNRLLSSPRPGVVLEIAILSAGAFVTWRTSPRATGEEPGRPLTRWAILRTDPTAAAGVADALTAALSREPGVELVERSDLDRVLKEQELSVLGGASGGGLRIRVGRLLGADALLILGGVPDRNASVVQGVLCDCGSGARLAVEIVPAPGDDIEAAVSCLVGSVRRQRERLPAGVRTVIGVSPFVSEHLVHAHDRYQIAFCRLLQQALSAHRGVAAIEVEEAQAIHEELDRAGPGAVDRRTPCMVNGEFQVTGPAGAGADVLSLRVIVTDGRRTLRAIAKTALPIEAAAGYFADELAPAVLAAARHSGGGGTLSAEAQFQALATRADRFAGLGAWREAVGLREAALLLRPASADQRRRLLAEYCNEMSRGFTPAEISAGVATECRRRIGLWPVARSHLEFLLHNRLVSQGEACSRIHRLLRAIYTVRVRHADLLKDLEREKKIFLIREFEAVCRLPRERHLGWDSVNAVFLNGLLECFDKNALDDEDLEAAFELVQRFQPEDRFSSQMWAYLLSDPSPFSAAAHRRFCERLAALPNPALSLAARFSDLSRRHQELKAAGQSPAALLGDSKGIREALKQAGALDFYLDGKTDLLIHAVERASGNHAVVGAARWHVPPPPPRRDPGTGRLRFTRIELGAEPGAPTDAAPKAGGTRRVGKVFLPPTAVENCGAFDVFWCYQGILYVKTPGLMREPAANLAGTIDHVRWDGQHVWVAAHDTGIVTLNADGNRIHRLGPEQGLPPFERGAMLHPIEPGRVVAVGSLGLHARAWCAVLDVNGARPTVHVFHTARRVLGENEKAEYALDPELVFKPHWIHEVASGAGGERRTLLIGRYARTVDARRRPLQIEWPSLRVSVSDLELGMADLYTSAAYFSQGGDILEAGRFHVLRYPPGGNAGPAGKTNQKYCVPRNREGVENGGLLQMLVPHEGWLYVPGLKWFRLDPETLREELLTPERLSAPYSDLLYAGVSAHYGLIAWKNFGVIYKLTVEPDAADDVESTPK